MGEVLQLFSTMVLMLPDDFLVSYPIHHPMSKFIESCIQEGPHYRKYEEDLMNLLCAICSKIRSFPELLNIFFIDRETLTDNQTPLIDFSTNEGEEKIPDYEFILFHYLLRFMHREGAIGDYARASLILLLKIPDACLKQFIIRHSDFPVMLVAGLGALFSRLPRQVELLSPISDPGTSPIAQEFVRECTEGNPLVEQVDATLHLSETSSDDLVCFVKLWEFTNDIVKAKLDPDIIQAILESLRSVLFENVFYPLYMTCSESDGSLIAINEYFNLMLNCSTSPRLFEFFVRFLLGIDPLHSQNQMDFLENTALSTFVPKERRFSLRHAIFKRLRSHRETTLRSILKLSVTMIDIYPAFTLPLLIEELNKMDTAFVWECAKPKVRIWDIVQHQVQLDRFLGLLPETELHGYDAYIRDAESFAYIYKESDLQPVSSGMKTSGSFGSLNSLSTVGEILDYEKPPFSPTEYALEHLTAFSNDPFLKVILDKLEYFLSNRYETNLLLTGILNSILATGHPLLMIYLLHADLLVSGQRSIYSVLCHVFSHIEKRKMEITDFDRLLKQRRAVGLNTRITVTPLQTPKSPTSARKLFGLFSSSSSSLESSSTNATPVDLYQHSLQNASQHSLNSTQSSNNNSDLLSDNRDKNSQFQLTIVGEELDNFIANVLIVTEMVKEIVARIQIQRGHGSEQIRF